MTNLAHWPDYIDDALGGDFFINTKRNRREMTK